MRRRKPSTSSVRPSIMRSSASVAVFGNATALIRRRHPQRGAAPMRGVMRCRPTCRTCAVASGAVVVAAAPGTRRAFAEHLVEVPARRKVERQLGARQPRAVQAGSAWCRPPPGW